MRACVLCVWRAILYALFGACISGCGCLWACVHAYVRSNARQKCARALGRARRTCSPAHQQQQRGDEVHSLAVAHTRVVRRRGEQHAAQRLLRSTKVLQRGAGPCGGVCVYQIQ